MNLNIYKALQIYYTKKDFIVYILDNDNKIKDMILTNDLLRHRNKFGKESRFKLIEVLKQELNSIKITI